MVGLLYLKPLIIWEEGTGEDKLVHPSLKEMITFTEAKIILYIFAQKVIEIKNLELFVCLIRYYWESSLLNFWSYAFIF